MTGKELVNFSKKGLELGVEDHKIHFLIEFSSCYLGCFLGQVFAGMIGNLEEALKEWTNHPSWDYNKFMSDKTGLPYEVIVKISNYHCSGLINELELFLETIN